MSAYGKLNMFDLRTNNKKKSAAYPAVLRDLIVQSISDSRKQTIVHQREQHGDNAEWEARSNLRYTT